MKTMIAVIAAACVLAGAASAAGAADQTLVDLETAWSKAFIAKDTAAMSDIIADTWSGHDSSGKFTKADLIGAVKSGELGYATMTIHDVHARVIGNIGIVQGMDDETSSYKGKDTSGTYSWTDVFENRGGKWQAIASQVSKVEK